MESRNKRVEQARNKERSEAAALPSECGRPLFQADFPSFASAMRALLSASASSIFSPYSSAFRRTRSMADSGGASTNRGLRSVNRGRSFFTSDWFDFAPRSLLGLLCKKEGVEVRLDSLKDDILGIKETPLARRRAVRFFTIFGVCDSLLSGCAL